MYIRRWKIYALCLALVSSFIGVANAKVSDNIVRIPILTDMQGPYSDIGGKASVAAAKMAIANLGGLVLGKKIELVVVDHQNKTDVAATTQQNGLMWIE